MKIPTILKGDDARAITLSLDSSHTYLNAVLVVAYQGVTKTFAGLSAGGTVSLVYAHDETKLFCLGCYPVEARLIGAGGSVETISNAEWRIKVTDILAEVNCGASFEVVPGSASVPVTDIEEIGDRYKLPDLAAKVNEICRILAQKTTLAIAIVLAAVGAFAASVQTARLDEMYNDAQVVTDVTFDPAPDFSPSNATLVATIRDEVGPISNDVAALSDSVKTNAAAIATLADTTATLSDSIVTGISNLSTRVDGKVEQTDFDAATNFIAGTIAPLAGIPALIPAQASPTNQLADKQFVNSSIATSTANFCGTSAATNEAAFVEWLEAIEVANDNDYVFWQTEDGDGNAVFKRYKYVEDPSGLGEEALAGHWLFEYDLNNSSFTAVQWAAINSGVTPEAVAKIANAATKAEAEALRNDKLDKSAVVSPSPSATAGQAADAKATGDALEPLLFAQYYPDGNVKSAAEFTPGITYHVLDTASRTTEANPFTDGSVPNNSGLSGRVVIPPFVDGNGKGYITDDGTRYKVVAVRGAGVGTNTRLTAIVAPNTVTTVKPYAFRRCTLLTSVSLPGVTDIESTAFGECYALPSVSLPAATTIGSRAFTACYALTSVSLPAATDIVRDAFIYCGSLSSVSLPATTNIGYAAFADLVKLESVDFGDTPRSSVPTLGDYAFNNVPTSCKFIVPDAQYNDWVAAPGWSDLVTAGYKFLRHSEWEYARRYELTTALAAATTAATNYTDAVTNALSAAIDEKVRVAPVEIPAGRTDVDAHGCVHNAPVELGLDAKATVDLSGLSSNAIVRSVSTAIGPGADASNPDNPSMQQGIAVGNQARAKGTNAIAIGAGVKHEDEDDLTGDNAYAGANEAIAGGYSAKATASQAVALGSRARAHAQGAWQLGEGVNSNRNTLAFRDYKLLGEDGQVPYERVAGAVAQAGVEFEAAVSNAVRRILAGGNMTLVCDGSGGEQILEPKVAGLSEVQFLTNTNGVHEASTLGYLDPPPISARNYDVLISEIPEPMRMGTNGWETVALENRLNVHFTELPPQYDVSMHVDESCGFQRSGRAVSITNAPTVVKLREVSTNKVLVVVKPYRLEDL